MGTSTVFSDTSSNQVQLLGPMPFDLKHINLNLSTIVIDGGLNHNLKLTNSISIGDGDSKKSEQSLDITHPKNKDYSDLKAALDLIPEHIKILNIYGLLGGRRDHETINFAEIYKFCADKKQVRTVLDQEIYILSPGFYTVEHAGTFSLFSYETSHIEISSKCEYPVTGICLKALSSQGLSNIAYEDIQIKVENYPVFIFLNKQGSIKL